MAWQDRPYYRDRSATRRNPLWWLLTGSVPLFTAFGIRVRMHAMLILTIALTLILSPLKGGLGPYNAVVSMVILFGSVLLHEFGHCFGSRYVGGDPDEILMWPLGGLASANPPHRPWASFFTTACGPAVNLLLCLLCGGAVVAIQGTFSALPWLEPLNQRLSIPTGAVSYYLWWIYLVNWSLFLFNVCLVFYPLDGGRMVQELLWVRLGYQRSMRIATTIGMIGGAVVVAVGLAFWNFSLALLGVFGIVICYRDRQVARETGPEDDWGLSPTTDLSAAYEPATPTRTRRRKVSRRLMKKSRRLAQRATDDQKLVDSILAKVSAQGMASLTWRERRALRKATESKPRPDADVRRSVSR